MLTAGATVVIGMLELLGFTGTRLARTSWLNAFLGGRVFTTRSGQKKHAAERWAGVVQRHPVLATVASAAFILILAAPALTPDVSVKQIGLGLAAAVPVDATVVRLVLVPAVMELLGTAN